MVSRTCVGFVCAVVYFVRGAVFFMATLFSFAVGEQVQMPLIAVGILHLVATKRAGSLPPFWALSRFFVAGVKSLGCLGKQVRERELVPRMAGLFALGHGCFPISFGVSWSGIGIVF